MIFLSTPSARRATGHPRHSTFSSPFLSTPSARRATRAISGSYRPVRHFYPRPPRGGRRLTHIGGHQALNISIHALREEGDVNPFDLRHGLLNFYPRPPRGGRPTTSPPTTTCLMISIHALREEGDVRSGEHLCWVLQFLSTPSARRATRRMLHEGCHTGISIHALREEGDLVPFCRLSGVPISIHALREEGDSLVAICVSSFLYFYPRPPRGGRHKQLGASLTAAKFLSTPSARRATPLRHHGVPPAGFLSTPSARRATREGPCRCRR